MSQTVLNIIDSNNSNQKLLVGVDQATGAYTPVQLAVSQVNGANVSATNPIPTVSTGGAFTPVTANSGGYSTWCASGATGGNPLLTETAVEVVVGQHALKGWDFTNFTQDTVYVQVFDLPNFDVTVGATPPKMIKPVPALSTWKETFDNEGIAFGNAITIAVTASLVGNTNPTAGTLANIFYR